MAQIYDRRDFLYRVNDDEELERELLDIFLVQAPGQIAALHEALDHQDGKQLQSQAHSLKGAAASISALALQEVAYRLEQAGQAGDFQQARPLMTRLITEFDALRQVLHGHLTGQ